jgi:hypothetical protein
MSPQRPSSAGALLVGALLVGAFLWWPGQPGRYLENAMPLSERTEKRSVAETMMARNGRGTRQNHSIDEVACLVGRGEIFMTYRCLF